MNARISIAALSFTAMAALSVLGLACSSSPPESEAVARVASPVIKGTDSDTSQDAVVLLVHYDPTTRQVGACTGTLLSDRLVLTARHCVADTDESAACDVKGNPLAQGAVRGNYKAETLYVFVGPNRPDFSRGKVDPSGIGAKILDDGGTNLCNHDIAMVVLKEPIANAKISPIRLDEPIKKGETLTAIGWGVTDTTTTPEIRQQRSGIKIEGIGPDDTNAFPVPPNEFEVGESICSGDSGGPALASTKAIVGVVSRGGNATQPDPQNPASSCIGGNNLYTKVAPFKSFILSGLALVGAEPWLENGPDPRLAKTGETCTAGSDCRSNLCARDPEGKGTPKCVDDCSVNACPDDMTCKVEGDVSLCRPPTAEPAANATTTTTTTGCAAAPGSSSPAGALGFVLAALGLVAVRRRRA